MKCDYPTIFRLFWLDYVINESMSHLLANSSQYQNFVAVDNEETDQAQHLIQSALKFFTQPHFNYTKDVVDICMMATVHRFDLNLKIFQDIQGKVGLIEVSGGSGNSTSLHRYLCTPLCLV